MPAREPITEEVKREVRKAAGFGCVICGIPIYHIDHIDDYAHVKEHNIENLTLLCPYHHELKNKGLLSRNTIREAKSDPANLRNGTTPPFLLDISSDEINIYIGNNHYSKRFTQENDTTYPVVVADQPLVTLRKKGTQILLSFSVFDKNGKLILTIIENEVMFSVDVWDVTLIGHQLIIRSAARNKTIEIFFDISSSKLCQILFTKGDFFFNGWSIKISRELKVSNPEHGSKSFSGFAIGDNPDRNFGLVIRTETAIPVSLGLKIGKCPSFIEMGCLIEVL